MTFNSGRAQVADRLALDENLSYAQTVAPAVNAISAAATSTTAIAYAISAQKIGAGVLGANGYINMEMWGVYSITASTGSLIATLEMNPGGLSFSIVSESVSATPTVWAASFYWQNTNNEATQAIFANLHLGRQAAPGWGPYRDLLNGASVDTSQDFTINLGISRTGSLTGKAIVQVATLTTYFLP